MKSTSYLDIVRETCRLVIRPTKDEDFVIIRDGLKGQGDQISKYDDEEIDLTEKYTESFCKNSVQSLIQYAEEDKAYMFRVFKRKEGTYVGGVIIKTILRKDFQWGEIGYWLLNQHWGNGFGSEMLVAAIDIAFRDLNFHRLEAYINLDNTVSQRTAERAGMELECIRKGFIYEDGSWIDNMIYAINDREHTGK